MEVSQETFVEDSQWGEDKNWSLLTLVLGEGNGNPLQHSCLENPRDRGAWWAAVNGVAQSRARLKRLSSSSSSPCPSSSMRKVKTVKV